MKKITSSKRRELSKALINAIESNALVDNSYLPLLARLSNTTKHDDKTEMYLERSAIYAEAIHDHDSAIDYYERTLRFINNAKRKKYAERLVKIGDLYSLVGSKEKALEYFSKAMKLNYEKIFPQIYAGMGRVYLAMGQNTEAISCLRKATSLISAKVSKEYIEQTNYLAYALLSHKKYAPAKKILMQSMSLTQELNDAQMTSETCYYDAVYEWFRGNLDEGIRKSQKNLEFAQQHQLVRQYAYTANLLSLLYQQRGDMRHAEDYLEKAITELKKTRSSTALAHAVANQASLSFSQGKLPKAKALFGDALTRALQTNNQAIRHLALLNLGLISEDLGEFSKAIRFYREALAIKADDIISNYSLAMVYQKKGELNSAQSTVTNAINLSTSPLYDIALALIRLAQGADKQSRVAFKKALKHRKMDSFDINIRINVFLCASRLCYEYGDFDQSSYYAQKLKRLATQHSKEYYVSCAMTKINAYRLGKIPSVNIDTESAALKTMGCVYDYTYLKRSVIESMVAHEIPQGVLPHILNELESISEILSSIGALLELDRVKKLRNELIPAVIDDYSRRIISQHYVDTFSQLAELISSDLGDENFIQKILDLIIKTTHAERGALFICRQTGMEFVAGRDVDKTTLQDATELSKTATKELDKNRIVFAEDAIVNPQFNIKKSVMLNRIRSLLCVPLSVSGNVIGALYLDSRLSAGIFDPQDRDFLLAVSKILASVIEKSMAFQSLSEENILLKSNIIKEIGNGYLKGKSGALKRIYTVIDDVAQSNVPVLVLGETGTGKGMLARLIHLKSKRRQHKFLTINCGTIPETLLESELFGHKRGAFTGAFNDKRGLLEEAQGGTIFLDEITNTSLSFQAKILEAIEEKIIRRLGETTTRTIDVRFLFATNKDLEIEVEEGRFRSDLYYRINVFSFKVPPLRERVTDIPLLAQFFLQKYSKEMNKKIEGFTAESTRKLTESFWPGNVRELQNVIERAVVLAKDRLITTRDLGIESKISTSVPPLVEIKKQAIIDALNTAGGSIKRAAQMLGINRRTVERYIKRYDIKK
jgi:Nif-specific regulatory protein